MSDVGLGKISGMTVFISMAEVVMQSSALAAGVIPVVPPEQTPQTSYEALPFKYSGTIVLNR
jgi:hypothetical protein